ncbi:tetratricopeptide repeat protein [Treponema pectinovorum]|uniref:tetratricopeptide repeat protein n=1 Tax=Treponema pectinovorum TaxID=164 RepID=UPI003D900D16
MKDFYLKQKNFFYSFAAFIFICLIFSSCSGSSSKTIIRMQKLETGVHSPTTEEELKEAIKKYEKRIADIQIADAQIGIWYKILATRYLDAKMYGKALTNFQKAIEYYPSNQNLFYYVGVCAGYMAKASLDYNATGSTSSQKFNYLKLAESAYLRAIELEPRYVRALYGLGVLYVFELDQCDKAIGYLETALSIETRNTDIMFVLARACYVEGDYDRAVQLYDTIISTSKSEQKKKEAQANKKIVLDTSYAN